MSLAAAASTFYRSILRTGNDPSRIRAADRRHAIAYAALHEKPELVAGWSNKGQIESTNAMLRNVGSRACAPADPTGRLYQLAFPS